MGKSDDGLVRTAYVSLKDSHGEISKRCLIEGVQDTSGNSSTANYLQVAGRPSGLLNRKGSLRVQPREHLLVVCSSFAKCSASVIFI